MVGKEEWMEGGEILTPNVKYVPLRLHSHHTERIFVQAVKYPDNIFIVSVVSHDLLKILSSYTVERPPKVNITYIQSFAELVIHFS